MFMEKEKTDKSKMTGRLPLKLTQEIFHKTYEMKQGQALGLLDQPLSPIRQDGCDGLRSIPLSVLRGVRNPET
ncbi:unnamed protein product [Darwinula stevensoni]|uniref:Uncharacterized protein n=1 Tax=Darwinula stevensoni TaxID=69355 RepID=A0A7R9FSW5_9CRUS|nr:unnamed protein product [Darwinula stevensoni]CAG0904683.1 unnamed protein product [Darwinula stevensoni]